jgi:hypothetical protein
MLLCIHQLFFLQRQLIAEIYKRRYEHEDLLEAIRKEVQDGPEKELILSLLEMPANLDAINLHKAIAVS